MADGTAKLSGRDYELREPTAWQEQTKRSEVFSQKLQGESGESQLNREKQQMTLKPVLKFIDATKSTHTDLDVMQEKRVDDCWNVDSNGCLSDSWKGFRKFTLLKEKSPNGSMWSRGRLTKVQTISRPDHVWPELWTKIGKAAQNREKQEWKNEKPKLVYARRLRWIYFIDLDDQGYKETHKKCEDNIGKTHGTSFTLQEDDSHEHHESGCKASNCISKVSTDDLWLKSGISWIHKAKSGIFSTCKTRWSCCRQRFYFNDPLQFGSQIYPDAKAEVDKEWKKLETTPAWQLEKVKSKKEVILEAQRDKKKVHFATLMDIFHLKNAELEPKLQKLPRPSRAPWWPCEGRLWSLCSFYWTGLVCVPNDCRKSNGCYCKLTRLWRTSSWSSISLYPRKIGGRSQIAQNSEVRMSGRMDTSSATHMTEILGEHWRSCGTSRTRFIWTSLGRIVVGTTIRRSSTETWMGKSTELGMSVCSSKTRIIFVSTCGWHYGWKEAEKGSHVEDNEQNVDLEEPTSFFDHRYLECTQRECKPSEIIAEEFTKMFESRISSVATDKLPGWEKPHAKTVAWCYDTEGDARKCVDRYCELANKVVQLQKVSSPCLGDHQVRQEELEWVGELSQVCSQIVLKCLYHCTNWKTRHPVVGQQTCKSSHKMDSDMWQTIGKIDFILLLCG